ncbi:MAG: RsmB/NOP family class I SAM-dependent RNA methyltransferase [Geminicoccaceae bacterium]
MDRARAVAVDALSRVLAKPPVALDEAFELAVGERKLVGRDRAFARQLLLTCLRQLAPIDRLIGAYLKHNPPALTRSLLRIGAAQLRYLEVPTYAVVSAMVGLAKRLDPRHAGLVNAVLRRVADAEEIEIGPGGRTPPWLFRSWSEAYGTEVAAAIEAAHGREAPLDLFVPRDVEQWSLRLGGAVLGTNTVRLQPQGAVDQLPGFDEGAWWVQDLAASLPVSSLGRLDGLEALDLCAAPGGKTAQLIEAGATVLAVEKDPRRAERLKGNLARLRLQAEIVVTDTLDMEGPPADLVLLDAPCSATGTIRRHPDIPWHRSPADVAALASLQDRLLMKAASLTKPGGRLLFVTCSLQTEEGPARVERFLDEHPGFSVEPFERSVLAPLAAASNDSACLRTLPSSLAEQGGMDGFFAATLRRNGA